MPLQNYLDQPSEEFRMFQHGLSAGWERLSDRERRSACYNFSNLIEDCLRDVEQTADAKRWSISSRLDWLAGQAERVENGGTVWTERR